MIGILGYAIRSGIGSLIQDYKKFLPIESHYVITHRRRGVNQSLITSDCVLEDTVKLEDWLDTIQTLIFIENPIYNNLLPLAKKRNIKVFCSVNIDWFNPKATWVKDVNMFIAPNKYTLHQLLENQINNCCYIPVSVDTEYFTFKPRNIVAGFLFNNGWGGYERRKNCSMVIELFRELKLPLTINTQDRLIASSPFVKVNIENYAERLAIYQDGDLYLAPTKWEGTGLHIVEAMACGLPVIVTDGEPMSEYMPIEFLRIKAQRIMKHNTNNFSALEFAPDVAFLKTLVRFFHQKNVSWLSYYCRELVESQYSWEKNKDKFIQILGV